MSELKIDVFQFVDEDEFKDIAKYEFSKCCEKFFENEDNFKRLVSNVAYDIVYKLVDKQFNSRLDEVLTDKVTDLISSLSMYNIFNKPDAWSKETNHAYDIYRKAIVDNKDLIAEVVKETIPFATVEALKDDVKSYVQEAVSNHFNVN